MNRKVFLITTELVVDDPPEGFDQSDAASAFDLCFRPRGGGLKVENTTAYELATKE